MGDLEECEASGFLVNFCSILKACVEKVSW